MIENKSVGVGRWTVFMRLRPRRPETPAAQGSGGRPAVPGRGTGWCKGPEAEVNLVCFRSRQRASGDAGE